MEIKIDKLQNNKEDVFRGLTNCYKLFTSLEDGMECKEQR
jgi:hypothetical protein